ncbi:MAG TPA: cytochrome c4, partial [Gammaproteobacteria bacterium]|nr:cytochrome c4 [Gammaproteobacteria bacterium]
QLKLFRQDSINAQTGSTKPSRANDYEGMMINFTKSLTNTEIDAVSEYIAGLH